MRKDSLGDRMKTYYEDRTKTYLPRRSDVIIRIDGCHFHTLTKKLEKPFDGNFIRVMQETALNLCEKIQGCKLAYVQSDEISLWLTDYDKLETDAWFNNSVQKICSVAASMAGVYFNKNLRNRIKDLTELKSFKKEKIDNLIWTLEENAYFDARCFTLPKQEVTNYFIWRQQDAIRNSINSLGQFYFSQKELNGLNTSQVKEKVLQYEDWDHLPPCERRGTCVVKIDDIGWCIVLDTPDFKLEREYIENRFPE